jgi:RNA polymerase sigma-70 factor (ECF subfamily)
MNRDCLLSDYFSKSVNESAFLFGYSNGRTMSVSIAFQQALRDKSVAEGPMTDETLYDHVIAPMESRMMRTIWRIVRQTDLAEDTLQDALSVLWAKRDRVRRHPNPQALILRICINCAYDALRRRERRRGQQDLSTLRWEHHTQENASDEIERKEVLAEVSSAIGRLPRKQAQAVLMRVVEGEDYEVIAQAMNCSETTARIHVHKGRKRLSQWLSHLKPTAQEGARNEG